MQVSRKGGCRYVGKGFFCSLQNDEQGNLPPGAPEFFLQGGLTLGAGGGRDNSTLVLVLNGEHRGQVWVSHMTEDAWSVRRLYNDDDSDEGPSEVFRSVCAAAKFVIGPRPHDA
jgi:hypothetical protein